MKSYKLTIASVAVLGTLVACGGGGGDSQPTDQASKYVGEWKTNCFSQSTIKDATTQNDANVTHSVKLTRVDNTTLTFAYTYGVYASTDKKCEGAQLGTIESTGLNSDSLDSGGFGVRASNGINQVKIDGTSTLGNDTVDQFTETRPALTSSLGANATVTVGTGNRFTFNTADFQANTEKNIAAATTKQFTLGVPHPTEYPTALGTTAAYIYLKVPEMASPPSSPSSSTTAINLQ